MKINLENQSEPAYPHSMWLPGSGVQRGSIMIGDSLTPGYPGIGYTILKLTQNLYHNSICK